MSKIEQIENSGGNTEKPQNSGKKQPVQQFYYCFTLNNYTESEIEQIEQIFRHETDWYVFQEEKGVENGTLHLQGTIKLKKKQRITELKKWNTRIHWEGTKSVSGSIAYCQKSNTKYGRVFSNGIELEEEVEIDEPYGWQLEVLDILKSKPDRRKIHWFWEPDGNVGKSSLTKYLVVKHKALILNGKSNDMFHALSKVKTKKIIIVDCPKSNFDYMNYGAIEQIKNGLIFSGKYDGGQIVFNIPHVIVFANEEPNYDMMSHDRWDVHRIRID